MDPRKILPHRPPFLFLDAIVELTPERARGEYRYRADESFFRGHFPDDPVVPGVIQIETMAQLFAALGIRNAQAAGLTLGKVALTKVDGCQLLRPLRPDSAVVVTVEREWFRWRTLQARGSLVDAASGELVAEVLLRGTGFDNTLAERQT